MEAEEEKQLKEPDQLLYNVCLIKMPLVPSQQQGRDIQPPAGSQPVLISTQTVLSLLTPESQT